MMLLMLVVGTASIGWMLPLGAAIAAEKVLSDGDLLARPLGGALLLWACVIVLSNMS